MNRVILLVGLVIGMGSSLVGQIPPNNLGQIVEVATPAGILPQPHVLIGWDSAGFVRQANSTDSFKVFSYQPHQTTLNRITTEQYPVNSHNRFSAPTGMESYEIRYGDSSYYWNGTALAANKLPFAVYAVGARSSKSQDTAVTHRLCIQRNVQGYYVFFSEMASPWDTTYWEMSSHSSIPYSLSTAAIRYWRTGRSSIPYTQTTWNQTTDSLTPPPGTVLRLVAANTDSVRPIIIAQDSYDFPNPTDTLRLSAYPLSPVAWSLVSAPENMVIDASGVIRWPYTSSQVGHDYSVVVRAENLSGSVYKTLTVYAGYAHPAGYVRLRNNNLDFWTASNGTIAFNTPDGNSGLHFNNPYTDLIYAGGFYVGTKKHGIGNAPDTITVSNVEFDTEFQPGRILNNGDIGTLVTEDPDDSTLGVYLLSDNAGQWPLEAPHDALGNPLKLSLRDSWTVFNDAGFFQNPAGVYEEAPMLGLEVQRQTFMFSAYPWNNAVLVRMRIINKSNRSYDSTFIGLWQDADVSSNPTADLAGCDSSLSLVYTYNGLPDVETAVSGTLLLQGPLDGAGAADSAEIMEIGPDGFFKQQRYSRTMKMANAAVGFRDPGGPSVFYLGDFTRYQFMIGHDNHGLPKPAGPFDIWYGTSLGDQRTLLSSGLLTFAAGDTQVIWYAYVGALGANDTAAVDTLKHYATLMRQQFQGDMNEIIVGIDEHTGQHVSDFKLYANYPNPFNPTTTIKYVLPKESPVSLKIYNVLGQEVRTLVNSRQGLGEHTVTWDGRNRFGSQVSSGVYLYRLVVEGQAKVRKMMMLK